MADLERRKLLVTGALTAAELLLAACVTKPAANSNRPVATLGPSTIKPADARTFNNASDNETVVNGKSPKLTLTSNGNPGFEMFYSVQGARELINTLDLKNIPEFNLHFYASALPNQRPFNLVGRQDCPSGLSEAYISLLVQDVLPQFGYIGRENSVQQITLAWNKRIQRDVWSLTAVAKFLCDQKTDNNEMRTLITAAGDESVKHSPVFWINLKPGENFQTNPIIKAATID